MIEAYQGGRMKRLAAAACAMLVLAGCLGPNNLSRGFDDWVNQTYVDSPWLGQLLLYIGLIPAVYGVTTVLDFAIGNVFDFWGQSAFRGTGTPFIHRNPAVPEPR